MRHQGGKGGEGASSALTEPPGVRHDSRSLERDLAELLSQAEIEALLASLGDETSAQMSPDAGEHGRGDASSTPSGAALPKSHDKRTVAYEVYDFRRPDKLSKDQLRTLQMLYHEKA